MVHQAAGVEGFFFGGGGFRVPTQDPPLFCYALDYAVTVQLCTWSLCFEI